MSGQRIVEILGTGLAQELENMRAALAVYAPKMTDPTMAGRLAGITIPALVISGESDRIVDPEYGRAYAAAIPGARFVLLPGTGHVPQIETPELLLETIWNLGQRPNS